MNQSALSVLTNSDFLSEALGPLDAGLFGWVCSFSSDPSSPPPSVWSGRSYSGKPLQASLIDRSESENNYFCTAVLRATDDLEIVRRKEAFERLAVLVVDDVQPDDVSNYSYCIQTSPGKFQVGIFLDAADPDTRNRHLIDRVMSALAARGRSNDASGNACVRYVRLPNGANTKPRPAGDWQVRLESWQPNVRWSLDDACEAVGIKLESLRESAAREPLKQASGVHAGEMIAGLIDPVPSQRVYHDSLVRLAASLVSNGMFPGAAVEFLRDLMIQVRPTGPAEEVSRWQARYEEIERAVRSAEKFAPQERKPPQITVNLSLAGSPDEPVLTHSDELVPLDWVALAETVAEPAKWRIDGWLPEGTVTLLSANGGVGKSNLSLQLAVSLTHGYPCVGMQTKQSRVLVLSGEDEARTVHYRVSNICEDLKVDIESLEDRLTVYDLTREDCVLWRDGNATQRMQWLADVVVRSRADVVIIDNASDVFADNENDRTAVRGFMRCLNMIAGETGAAILLLAHVDKASVRHNAGIDSSTTFSGSTAWNNSARSRWAMIREEESIVLRHEKSNLGAIMGEIRLEFDPAAKVLREFGASPGLKSAAQLTRNAHRIAILRLLDEADKAGQNLSLSGHANNNAFKVLRGSPHFPRVDRPGFFAILFEFQRDALIEEIEYVNERRKFKRISLTDKGHNRLALGGKSGREAE